LISILLVSLCFQGCEKAGDPPDTVRDIDGNIYKTVKIGKQVWMAENLRVTRYRNGTTIPRFTSNIEWSGSAIGLCTDYNFMEDSVKGLLYNWNAVETYKDHYLAPEGWHIPTESEWRELIKVLGGDGVAGSMLKDTLYWSPLNFPKERVSSFKAVPSGIRDEYARFQFDDQAFFWTSSRDSSYIYNRMSVVLFSGSDNIQLFSVYPSNGFSVRCVKDN